MSEETTYTVKVTPAKKGGDDYLFTATDGIASFNTRNGYKGASLKCETKNHRLVEAFSKLEPEEKMDLLADLTLVKLAAEISKSATDNLASGLYYSSKVDPIGIACKAAGF